MMHGTANLRSNLLIFSEPNDLLFSTKNTPFFIIVCRMFTSFLSLR